jgi:hypothetical protein
LKIDPLAAAARHAGEGWHPRISFADQGVDGGPPALAGACFAHHDAERAVPMGRCFGDLVSVQFLLNLMGEREQPLLDLAGYIAGIAQGLATILEHLDLPAHLLRHLLYRVGI